MRQSVYELHPSATAFNHAITEVNLDGQKYWLDATANYQRGPLAVRSWRNYGYGLVVRPGTTALTPIEPSPVLPKTTVTQYLQLGQVHDTSALKVVTIAEGADAEGLRALYNTTVRNEIERANLNYYARLYPEIVSTAPIVYTDDEQQNKIEVDEFYNVEKIWKPVPNQTYSQCRVYPVNVETAVLPPAVSLRTMPLGVSYPQDEIFRAEVTMPTIFPIQSENQNIENPAFFFHRSVSIGDGKILLEYEYRSLSDVVFPEAVPNYVRQLDTAAQSIGYTISSN
jgi:hypothetical protein